MGRGRRRRRRPGRATRGLLPGRRDQPVGAGRRARRTRRSRRRRVAAAQLVVDDDPGRDGQAGRPGELGVAGARRSTAPAARSSRRPRRRARPPPAARRPCRHRARGRSGAYVRPRARPRAASATAGASSSSWRSMSRGPRCSSVTARPRPASPRAASSPSTPAPSTTAWPAVPGDPVDVRAVVERAEQATTRQQPAVGTPRPDAAAAPARCRWPARARRSRASEPSRAAPRPWPYGRSRGPPRPVRQYDAVRSGTSRRRTARSCAGRCAGQHVGQLHPVVRARPARRPTTVRATPAVQVGRSALLDEPVAGHPVADDDHALGRQPLMRPPPAARRRP